MAPADALKRFTKLAYTAEGSAIADALWEETMTELEFAKVRDVLKECRAGG